MTTPTNAQLLAQVGAVVASWNLRETQYRDWLGGDAEGGPNADGKYPLTDGRGDTYLVDCPARLRETVYGPTGSAQEAKFDAQVAALTSSDEAARSSAERALAQAARAAADAARDMAQTHRQFAANHRADALLYRDQTLAARDIVTGAQPVIETARKQVADNAALVVQKAQEAAASAALAATFTPSLFVATSAFTWANLGGKPSTFAPSAHTHAIAEVVGLQSALDAKQAAGAYVTTAGFTWAALAGKPATFASDWSTLAGKPATFAPGAHVHAVSEVTGLQAALDARLLVATGAGGAGQAVWQQAALGFDSAVGDGLLNIAAGATHVRQNATSGTGYSYQGTRGASRIGFHDNSLNFYAGSKVASGGQVAGEAVAWTHMLSLTPTVAQFLVQPQFGGVNLMTSNDVANATVNRAKGVTTADPNVGAGGVWVAANKLWFADGVGGYFLHSSRDFDPASKASRAGDTFTGNVTFPASLQVGQGVANGLYGDGNNVALRGYATGAVYLQTQAGVTTNILLEPTKNTVYQPTTFTAAVTTTGSLFVGAAGGLYVTGQAQCLQFDPAGGTRVSYRSGHATAVGINLMTNDAVLRGVLYADGSGTNMGFLNPSNGWRLRADASNLYIGDSQWTTWHAGNLAPMTSNTGQVISQGVKEFVTVAGNVWQNIAPFNTYISTLGVRAAGGSGDSAAISFHRPGQFAAHFGLDHLNRWSVGGWSMGDVRRQLWVGGQVPTNSWERTDDGVGRFYFVSGSDTIYGTANIHSWRNGADSTIMHLTGNGELRTNSNIRASGHGGTGQFTAVIGSTMFGLYSDGNQGYLLKNAASSTSFDAHRPFYVNLASGAVTLDGTGAGGVATGGQLAVNGTLYANGEIVTPGWIRVSGSNGLYWQNWGGGWHMTDSTWMRSYGGKNIYTSGFVQADAGMTCQGGRVFRHADGAYANSSITYSTAAPSGGADGDVWFQYA